MSDYSLVAIGCYTETMPHVTGAGKGIEIVALNTATGALEKRLTTTGPRNPSYLAVNSSVDRLYAVDRRLYAVEELDAKDGPRTHAYALDASTGALTPLGTAPCPGTAACHVSVSRDGRRLYVSNYVTGDLLCYALDARGRRATRRLSAGRANPMVTSPWKTTMAWCCSAMRAMTQWSAIGRTGQGSTPSPPWRLPQRQRVSRVTSPLSPAARPSSSPANTLRC